MVHPSVALNVLYFEKIKFNSVTQTSMGKWSIPCREPNKHLLRHHVQCRECRALGVAPKAAQQAREESIVRRSKNFRVYSKTWASFVPFLAKQISMSPELPAIEARSDPTGLSAKQGSRTPCNNATLFPSDCGASSNSSRFSQTVDESSQRHANIGGLDRRNQMQSSAATENTRQNQQQVRENNEWSRFGSPESDVRRVAHPAA